MHHQIFNIVLKRKYLRSKLIVQKCSLYKLKYLTCPKSKKHLLVKERMDFLDRCFTAFILTVSILLFNFLKTMEWN